MKESWIKFKQERDEQVKQARKEAQTIADKAYNKGLWDAVKWRNPLAYLVLKR